MLNRCFATSSLDALRVYFDPRTIDPVASNTALSFSFDRPGALAARPTARSRSCSTTMPSMRPPTTRGCCES